jgi:hypothetical protein
MEVLEYGVRITVVIFGREKPLYCSNLFRELCLPLFIVICPLSDTDVYSVLRNIMLIYKKSSEWLILTHPLRFWSLVRTWSWSHPRVLTFTIHLHPFLHTLDISHHPGSDALNETYLPDKSLEFLPGKRLGESVRQHLVCRAVFDSKFSWACFLSQLVVIDIHMSKPNL